MDPPEPMTTAEDLFKRLIGKKYLSKIDHIKDIDDYLWHHKTTFSIPEGQYGFRRMPFGMVNSGDTLI